VRRIALFCMMGCGAPIYFPVEPPPFAPDSASPTATTGDTGGITGTLPTDTGTPYTPPGTPTAGGLPCSFYGDFGSTLTIRNTGSSSLMLYWRDFYCFEYFYGYVVPGEDFVQGTYENHAWVVRDVFGNSVSSLVVHEEEVHWEVP
jgi:hypothetical protein